MTWLRYLGISLLVSLAGCASTPIQENPYTVRGSIPFENPLFVPQGHDPQQYQRVYDIVYDVCQTYFDIANSNMYAGEIVGVPRVSGGVFDWCSTGWYDGYEIWESTTQSMRRRLLVQITPAEVGGYFVLVKVIKELEDPGRAVNPLQIRRVRPDDTVDAYNNAPQQLLNERWIDKGRDTRMEEAIISKLKEKL
ncbi:MAG: hypothetical protein JNJ77_04525 [Planctomycetia bacterium]|nr:hypothetical protein [Planctomycetia bacterium]